MLKKPSADAPIAARQARPEFGRKSSADATLEVVAAPDAAGKSCRSSDPSVHARLTAMSGMASMLAHELSQPLTAANNFLLGSSVALRQRICELSEVLEMVEQANDQTAKAGDLIRRMRTFVLDGKVEGRREDLRAIVASARSSVPGIDAVAVASAFDPDAVFVLADRIQIELVVANLLLNAVQALKGRDVRRITIHATAAEGRVSLRIQDSGPGLTDEAMGRLFEPFFTTRDNGMGLGLPICQTLMLAHGGEIQVERPVAGGAAFTLLLPKAPAEAA